MKKKITVAIIWFTLLVWGGWDLYVYFTDADDSAMFSRVVLSVSAGFLPATFLLGYLAGHFTWPQGLCKYCDHCRQNSMSG